MSKLGIKYKLVVTDKDGNVKSTLVTPGESCA